LPQVDASITRYLAGLDRAIREHSDVAEARTTQIKEKIANLRRQMQVLKDMEQQVATTPDQQVPLTDPDARSIDGRGPGRLSEFHALRIGENASTMTRRLHARHFL
jgi:hypothetical protein